MAVRPKSTRRVVRFYGRARWHTAIERSRVHDYALWFKQIPWKLFCTFTFAWKVSDPQAIKIFDAFINRLERVIKCDVGYLRGDEKRFSGLGKPACARHFHVLMVCANSVDPRFVEALWMSMAGSRSDGAGAQVKAYDANLNGESYVLKQMNQAHGDWDHRKLHLFLPSLKLAKPNSRHRRTLRRHQDRIQEGGE